MMMHYPRLIVCSVAFALPTSVIASNAPEVFGQILGTMIRGSGQQQTQPQQQSAPDRRSSQQSPQQSTKPAAKVAPPPPLKNAYNSKSAVQRIQIQTNLKQAGHYNSTIDGLWGDGTQAAIESYANTTQATELLASFAGANTLLANILSIQSGGQSSGQSPPPSPPQTPATTAQVVTVAAASTAVASTQSASNERDELKSRYNAMRDQLALLQEILKHQQSQAQSSANEAKITALQARIGVYVTQTDAMSTQYQSRYTTPIRPANANLGITAAKAAEIFPKIPYYIPGTEETGEMLVVPTVTETGELKYDFSFLDPGAQFGTVRESIMLAPKDIQLAIEGFDKVSEWSEKAHKEGIRRRFDKRATCFPVESCQEKKTGISSTEIDFLIYEDGATAARVQRNKGTFSSGYNFSMESSMLLASYLEYMRDIGQKEFSVGSMTEGDMHNMFK